MHKQIRCRVRRLLRHLRCYLHCRRCARAAHEIVLGRVHHLLLLRRHLLHKLHLLHLWRIRHSQLALRIDYRHSIRELHRQTSVHFWWRHCHIRSLCVRRRQLELLSIHELLSRCLDVSLLRLLLSMHGLRLHYGHESIRRKACLNSWSRLWRSILRNHRAANPALSHQLLLLLLKHGRVRG